MTTTNQSQQQALAPDRNTTTQVDAPHVQADTAGSDSHDSRAGQSLFQEVYRDDSPWTAIGNRRNESASQFVGDLEITDTANDGQLKPPNQAVESLGNLRLVDGKGRDASPVDSIRKKLQDNGIDPDKLTTPIVIREPRAENPAEHPFADMHITTVGCTISDPVMGLSRNADLKYVGDEAPFKEMLAFNTDGQNPVEAFARNTTVAVLDSTTKTLHEQFLQPDSKARVMNISAGTSAVDLARTMLDQIRDKPQEHADVLKQLLGEEKANELLSELTPPPGFGDGFGDSPDGQEGEPPPPDMTPGQCTDIRQPPEDIETIRAKPSPLQSELFKKLLETSERTLNTDPEVRRAQEQFRETARQVAEKGGIIVVSAGNAGDTLEKFDATSQPGAEFNVLGKSDHVIAVGGSDMNGTYDDESDDKIFAGSARGDARYKPTVIAPGADVPTRQNPEGVHSGTSYSSPLVANGIGLMLEQNPRLSFNEVKTTLQANARRLHGVDTERQGAGILQIADAVIAARDGRPK